MEVCFLLVKLLFIVIHFECGFLVRWGSQTDPEEEWSKMQVEIRSASPRVMPQFLRSAAEPDILVLPEFVMSSSALDQKGLFAPGLGARQLPDSLLPILYPPTVMTITESPEPKLVEALCHIDRLYVRIRRDVFNTMRPWRYLKLGTCIVNQLTDDHYYLLYLLKDCGHTFTNTPDVLFVRNVLRFDPKTAILRDLPFNVTVECRYRKYVHSYKVGVRPRLRGNLHKSLRMKNYFVLVPQDASGAEKTTPYNMNDVMYFEIRPTSTAVSANNRLYVNKCFITSTRAPSGPQNAIIDNYGCMVDGQESESSKFHRAASKSRVRFSIKAGTFPGVTLATQQLYLHCEVNFGEISASEGAKSCNYNLNTDLWEELYDDDALCLCCSSFCPPPLSKPSRTLVTSQPLNMNSS